MEASDGFVLKVMVTAPPKKGKANIAVAELLAKKFGVSKNCGTLVAGKVGWRKILRIKGDPVIFSPNAQQWMNL
jgi:uncharacterized protein YggU (UPF0235/DUF167 family)